MSWDTSKNQANQQDAIRSGPDGAWGRPERARGSGPDGGVRVAAASGAWACVRARGRARVCAWGRVCIVVVAIVIVVIVVVIVVANR